MSVIEIVVIAAGLLFLWFAAWTGHRNEVKRAKRILRDRRAYRQQRRTARKEGRSPPLPGCDEWMPYCYSARRLSRYRRMNPEPRERKLLSGHTE